MIAFFVAGMGMTSKLTQIGKYFVIYFSIFSLLNSFFGPQTWAMQTAAEEESQSFTPVSRFQPTLTEGIFPQEEGPPSVLDSGSPPPMDDSWTQTARLSASQGLGAAAKGVSIFLEERGEGHKRLRVYFKNAYDSLFPDLSRKKKVLILITSLVIGLGASFAWGELFTDNPGTSFLFNFSTNPAVLPRVTGAIAIFVQAIPQILSSYYACVSLSQGWKSIQRTFSSQVYSPSQRALKIASYAIISVLGAASALKLGFNFYEVEINSKGPDEQPLRNYKIFGSLIGPYTLTNLLSATRLTSVYRLLKNYLFERAALKNQASWGKQYHKISSAFRKLALAVNKKDSSFVIGLAEEIQTILQENKTDPAQMMQKLFSYLYKKGEADGIPEKEPSRTLRWGRGISIVVGTALGMGAGGLGGLNIFTRIVGANGYAIALTIGTIFFTGASFGRSFSEKWRSLYARFSGNYDHQYPKEGFPKLRTTMEVLSLFIGMYTNIPSALISSQLLYHLGHLTRGQLIPLTLAFSFGYGVSDSSSRQWQNLITELNDLKSCLGAKDQEGKARETILKLIQYFLQHMDMDASLIKTLHAIITKEEMDHRSSEPQAPASVAEAEAPDESTSLFSSVKSKLRAWFVNPFRRSPHYPA
jgi:hypothetical protein